MDRFKETADFILKHKRVILAAHEKPDGDAIGSIVALTIFLNEAGLKADCLLPDEMPDSCLPFVKIPCRKSLSLEELNSYDCFISVDCSSKKRLALGNGLSFDDIKIPFVNIDHHIDNNLGGVHSLIVADAAASASVVYSIARAAGWNCSVETATLLYLGLAADTGTFRFDNTSPDALRIAADLREAGADLHAVVEKMYFSRKLSMLKFEGEIVSSSLFTACNGRFAWIRLTEELMTKHSIELRNTENLIDLPRSLDGVSAAAMLRAQNGGFKVSLRSKDPKVSVGSVARKLDGGGHEMAAGGFIKASTFEEAEAILIAHIQEILN